MARAASRIYHLEFTRLALQIPSTLAQAWQDPSPWFALASMEAAMSRPCRGYTAGNCPSCPREPTPSSATWSSLGTVDIGEYLASESLTSEEATVATQSEMCDLLPRHRE